MSLHIPKHTEHETSIPEAMRHIITYGSALILIILTLGIAFWGTIILTLIVYEAIKALRKPEKIDWKNLVLFIINPLHKL